MLRIHFTPADLARTTVAAEPDPLWEIVLSRFRLDDRHRPAIYRPWVHALNAAAHPSDRSLRAGRAMLSALAPHGPYFPDFLTPADARAGFDAGLDALCRTPRRELRRQVARVAEHTRLPTWARSLGEGDTGALTEFATALRAYHDTAITPHATVIRRSIAADHAHRMRFLATDGLDGLLDSMRPVMRWRRPVLEVDYAADRDVHLDGRGLRLVPSYFCDRVPVSLADPTLPPVLVYPIAQEFAWRAHDPTERTGALDALLGNTRAAVLRAVGSGITTTQLARYTGTSLASASRHATVLRAAGLISSQRHRTAILHSITPLGTALLDDV